MSHESRPDAGFTCIRRKQSVTSNALGTAHRNHCPFCLWSRRVDDEPGDRRNPCREPLEPVAIEVRRDGEWALVHHCTGCGTLRTNRIASDDRELALLALVLRPVANPAFPLDAFTPGAHR